MDSELKRVCFKCGSRHKGEDVICDGCKREIAEAKTVKPSKRKSNFGQTVQTIINAVHVLIALVTVMM